MDTIYERITKALRNHTLAEVKGLPDQELRGIAHIFGYDARRSIKTIIKYVESEWHILHR